MQPITNDIGAYITTRQALDADIVGAGQGGSGDTVNGPSFHRTAFRPLHLSTKVVVPYNGTVASGATVTGHIAVQDSADGNSWDPFDTASGSTVITGDASGVVRGAFELDVNLLGARDYIRACFTPTLSASGTSIFSYNGVFVLGGGETLPAGPLTAL